MLMVSLDELVNADHQYRKFKSLFKFKAVEAELLVSLSNKKGPVNCTKKGPLYVKIFMSNDLQIYSY